VQFIGEYCAKMAASTEAKVALPKITFNVVQSHGKGPTVSWCDFTKSVCGMLTVGN
jgi:hypothetical protein